MDYDQIPEPSRLGNIALHYIAYPSITLCQSTHSTHP